MSVGNYSYFRRRTFRRLIWISFSRIITFFIPNFILHYIGRLTTPASRDAWREKIATLLLYLFSAGFFCFWLEVISSYFCDPEKTYAFEDVFSNHSKMSAINGRAVYWKNIGGNTHMVNWVNEYSHYDLSPNFPRFMILNRPSGVELYQDSIINDCVYNQNKAEQADAWLDYLLTTDSGYQYDPINGLTQCPDPNHRNVSGSPCYYSPQDRALFNSLPTKGDIEYDPEVILRSYNALPTPDNSTKQAFVILDGYVLDVTAYLSGATTIIPLSSTLSSRSFAQDRMFLPLDLTLFLYINLGRDITDYFDGNVTENPTLYRNCLIHLFKNGVVPSHVSAGCRKINPALWATMGVGLLYFLVKINLVYLSRVSFIKKLLFSSSPEYSSAFILQRSSSYQNLWPYTILMVPCFAESSETLKQTVESLSRTAYDDKRKLLLFVCDGVITNKKEQKSTHSLLLEFLGYSGTEEPLPQPYTSLGQSNKKLNFARVYSGYYESGRNRVPYLVVVKVGQPQEETDFYQEHMTTAPPGNRGKRDSLLLVFSFLERCMNLTNNLITPLDYELFNQCYNVLGIDPRYFKYMMVTDADIQVQGDVVQKLVSRLEQDRKMLAVSGHIRPANPEENMTTMLQIFPAYLAYFSSLAYEACLKSVMSINGGLVMYKIWTENSVPREEQNKKFIKKWKSLQKNSNNKQLQNINHQRTSDIYDKYPKISDEIIITNPFQDPDSSRKSSVSDESVVTASTATTTATDNNTSYSHNRHHTSSNTNGTPYELTTFRHESRLSLATRADIKPCCVHPTVLRGISMPQCDTMHMQNVLLLGEEKMTPIILLKSHPGHRLGFEPDAVGYAILPTNFFVLQGIQSRTIRAVFHTQLEMQRISWQVGFSYWLLSTFQLLDMIFSMPIMVYLYSVFIRSINQYGLAYYIIACSFAALALLHIILFLLRRQFRYILWFVLYCLISLPLFVIWFPILAVWQSNSAQYWYDTWPTIAGRRARLHGIIDHSKHKLNGGYCMALEKSEKKSGKPSLESYELNNQGNNNSNNGNGHSALSVPRWKFVKYEVAEAKRLHQAAEAALDSNFIGFTGFANDEGGNQIVLHSSNLVNDNTTLTTDSTQGITAPPLAQIRNGIHSTRTTNYRPSSLEMYSSASWKNRYPKFEEKLDSPNSNQNPFIDTSNPFDDDYYYQFTPRGYSEESGLKHRNYHRPSHSQSSYLTYSSQQNDSTSSPNTNMTYSIKHGTHLLPNDITDESTLPSSLNSSGFAKLPNVYNMNQMGQEDKMMTTIRSTNIAGPLLLDDHPQYNEIYGEGQHDRASTLSISSNTFSVYTPEDLTPEDNDTATNTNRYPRHRIVMHHSNNLEDEASTVTRNDGHESGRNRAVHNFAYLQQPSQNASNVNLRQQFENHATLRINIHQNNSSSNLYINNNNNNNPVSSPAGYSPNK